MATLTPEEIDHLVKYGSVLREDSISFVVTVRRRDGIPLDFRDRPQGRPTDFGRVRKAIHQISSDHDLRVLTTGNPRYMPPTMDPWS